MAGRDLVVIGASAGGVEALTALAARLPADLKAAVLVVLHLSPTHKSVLPQILRAAGPLPAKPAVDGEAILPGTIYVAGPDRHLVVEDSHLFLPRTARENGHRPAVDSLFRSAAVHYGARTVGVVLSGALDDGTAGLHAVKRRGGVTIVQDPEEALCGDMPRSALQNVEVDHCLPIAGIAALIARLASDKAPLPESPPVRGLDSHESRLAASLTALDMQPPGTPSPFGCPTCGGVLNEVHDGGQIRFRCRVGHGFTPETLRAEQRLSLEAALWTAVRALEEQAALAHRLAGRSREQGRVSSAERNEERAQDAEQRARQIRQVLMTAPAMGDEPG